MGRIFILLFVILGSIQDVYLGSYFQTQHPIVVAFSTFFVALIIFQLLLIGKNLHAFSIVWSARRDFLLLNITTLLNWLCFFAALKFIEPAIAGAVAFSLGPSISTIWIRSFKPQIQIPKHQWISALGTSASLVVLIWASLTGKSSVLSVSWQDALVGTALSCVSAVGISINTYMTKRLSDRNIKTASVMAFRFVALTLISGILILIMDLPFPIDQSRFVTTMIILAIVAVVLPIYLLQKGIEKTEAYTVSILLALTPATTMAFEFFDGRLEPSAVSIAGIILCSLFSVYGALK